MHLIDPPNKMYSGNEICCGASLLAPPVSTPFQMFTPRVGGGCGGEEEEKEEEDSNMYNDLVQARLRGEHFYKRGGGGAGDASVTSVVPLASS